MIPESELPLAVTIGEPAGIGPEVILKAWRHRQTHSLPPFMVIGDPDLLAVRAAKTGLAVPVIESTPEEAASEFDTALPVLPLSGSMTTGLREADTANGPLVVEAIETAVSLTMAKRTTGVVTAPINKKALYDCGFEFPGHTEFLAELSRNLIGKPVRPVMMLAGPALKTVPVTIHIPLKDVPGSLTSDLIVETVRIAARDLQQRFDLPDPVIAVSGINPHAGEEGALGEEEIRTVIPALQSLRADGIDVRGPYPGDTMFHARARETYDLAVCMYHDQALIPAKTLAFDEAVNVTLGLPFIRTSPDHGTAFDIAGTGKANPSSLIAALKMAAAMAVTVSRNAQK